jgi:hypothetical protein
LTKGIPCKAGRGFIKKLKNHKKWTKNDVPGNWGKIARDCYDPKRYGKIIGLGYDSGDYYLIIENPDTGEESTILMNTKYTIDS